MCYDVTMYQQLFQLQEEVFKVLANHKRLEIIQLLSDRELSVSEMITMLGLPQANLSQHLAQLRQAKVVDFRRDGQTIYYRLADQRICQACTLIREMLRDSDGVSDEERRFLDESQIAYPIVKDVVCGMRVSVSAAGDTVKYKGDDYYFCASGCRQMFEAHPQKYVKKEVING